MQMKVMSLIKCVILSMLLVAASPEVFAHGGGLDSYGCHNNRKVGNYHCHRGEFAGRTFASKEAMLKALEEQRKGNQSKS
jgi:hypothetical protein